MNITHILERPGLDPKQGYTRHRLVDGDAYHFEGWQTVCGRVMRSRAMLAHPLLPARSCPQCAEIDDRVR